MSYISVIQNFLEKLNQPSGIAAMASVGIHGILGLTLPYMPVFSREEPIDPQMVQLMALSPTELSRIPDLSLAPIPPYIYQQTPLKSGSLPLTPLNPPTNNLSNRSQSRLDPEALKRELARRLGGKVSRKIYPSPIWQRRRFTREDIEKVVDPSKSNFQPPTNPNTTVPVLESNPDPTKLPSIPSTDNNNPNQNQTTPPNQQPGGEIATTRGVEGENIKPDQPNSTNDPVSNDLLTLIQKRTPERLTIIGNYPKDACTNKLQGTTIYGIVVSPDTKILTIQLTKSAGSPILDRQAEEEIKSLRLANQTGNPKPYRVTVNFEYKEEACQVTNSPAPPEGNQTTPQPSDAIKPQETNPTPSQESEQTKPQETNPTSSQESEQTKPEPQASSSTVP
ncbi:MAG TPA: hypothetical protein DCY91_30435 [Cyanobacteria bacterium UBA11370]|nr:hypothetical protein [Cyanobacteria bacterium UBA11370]